ncbi:MAG TPA: hypothetical protein VLS93_14525, partial [Anaeromyxobacteraceae bacterium]|nr:hypothetical protein [Anaeromyxobacteraceae bacterium]
MAPAAPPALSPPLDLAAAVRHARLAFRPFAAGVHEAAGPTFRARVDERGALSFSPEDPTRRASLVLALGPASVGRAAAPLHPAAIRRARDGTLVLAHGAALERLRATDGGVQQSWSFPERPPGHGDLRVRLPAAGLEFAGSTAAGLHFADPATGTGVRYGQATWVDAAGVRTRIEPRWTSSEISLVVPAEVLDRSAYPAVLDPLVSPESAIDEPLLAAAPDAQDQPVAAADGSLFLVAWVDRRSHEASEIHAARVALDGTVLDPVGFLVAGGPGTRRAPAVAAGGGVFLVAWEEVNGSYGTLRGLRVGADGSLVDAAPFDAGSEASLPSPRIAAAFDGTTFRLAWVTASASSSATCCIRLASAGADGALLGAAKVIYTSSFGSCGAPVPPAALACEGATCLVAWAQAAGLMLGTFDRSGNPIDAFRTTALSRIAEPSAAFDGARYFVVWQDDRASTGRPDVYGARVSTAASMLDVGGLPIAMGGDRRRPAIAFDGTNHLVVWEERDTGGVDVLGARLSPDGAVLDLTFLPVAVSPGSQLAPAVAASPSGALVAYEDARQDSAGDVYATRLSTAGGVLDPEGILVGRSGNRESAPVAAFDGSTWLVAWEDSRAASSRESGVYGLRLAADGTPLDAAAFPISDGPATEARPAVAACGDGFLVAWSDYRNGGGADVFAARVSASGSVRDPSGIAVATGDGAQGTPAVACGDGGALVVWQALSTYSVPAAVRAARVDADGTVLDPGGLTLPGPSAGAPPSVAAGGGGFVVAWHAPLPWGGAEVLAARIAADGSLGPVEPLCAGPGLRSEPHLAFDGAGFQVAFAEQHPSPHVRTARLSASGSALDGCGASLPGSEGGTGPRIAYDGARHLALWRDGGTGEIRGSQLAPGGAILASFVASPASDEARAPHAACDGVGRCLLTYERLDAASGITRARLRWVTSDAPAPRCSGPGECASGFCVDGVCCDGACGGGDPGDCLACSVAAGAPGDGACAPVAPGGLCRGGPGCDASERCDGSSTACPPDQLAPDGESCDDGNGCTRLDACRGGACVGEDPVVCPPAGPCASVVCVPETGTCRREVLPARSPCDDGDPCTNESCNAYGECVASEKFCPYVPCNSSSCDGATGECRQTPVPDGSYCSDGSMCTTQDWCEGGACTGHVPVVCLPPDACHETGLCDRATGACAYAPKADGMPCDDGNACTLTDACAAGACTGTEPVVCAGGDVCHAPGACDPATGGCGPPAERPDGTACDDGNACTRSDGCLSGVCTGSDPVVCAATGPCREPGLCNPSTGACAESWKGNGTPCDDGDACTEGDACLNGECGGAQVGCPDPGACRGAACVASEGGCTTFALEDGTACP